MGIRKEKHYRHEVQEHRGMALRELFAGNDLTTVVVGAALLDNALEHALRFHFTGDKATIDRLFESDRSLQSFSTKIDVCYALGLIGKATYENLRIIRDIRNEFAHKLLSPGEQQILGSLSFKTRQVVGWCSSLKAIPGWNAFDGNETPRYKFSELCLVITDGLISQLEKATKPSVSQPLLP